ncbi:MAG: DUF58 domain-containing protein [Candidatus Wallbacteria bacterium]|nr:DUF58 domain-containing protein [Candidatus Wallbacteria bacterium]
MLSSLVSRLSFHWMQHFTPQGLIVFIALAIATLSSFSSFIVPVHHCFFGLLFLLLASLAGRLLPRKLALQTTFPVTGQAGKPIDIMVSLASVGNELYHVGADFFRLPRGITQPRHNVVLPLVPSDGKVHLRCRILPVKRGIYSNLTLAAYSTFPFGLLRRFLAFSVWHRLIVIPAYCPLKTISLPAASRYQPGGLRFASGIGESLEYIGNREYTPGDSGRHIDFRSFARLAKPIVREYREEYFCRVALFLDTCASAKSRESRNRFESAVSLCAAITDYLASRDYVIDFFASGSELHFFRSGRSTGSDMGLMETLAALSPEKSPSFSTIIPALCDAMRGVSFMIFVLQGWNTEHQALVRALSETRCPLKIIIIDKSQPAGISSCPWPVQVLNPQSIMDGGVDSL